MHPNHLHPDLERVLLTEQQLRDRVAELGRQIAGDYQGKELLLVGILKGAAVFCADLMRAIDLTVSIDFLAVSSYGKSSLTTGVHRIIKDLDESIEGRHVLLVEDIVDTGLTLNFLRDHLRAREPASLAICAMLDKPERRKVAVDVRYVGFEIPDVFVVGYGLDYSERYRNLPFLAELKRSVYSQ